MQKMQKTEREEQKSHNEYDELKDSRHKSLVKEFQDYLITLKVHMSYRNSEECRKLALRDGELDQIDEKVCLRRKEKQLNVNLMRILPQLTQHANSYEQCLKECSKNHISYVVANQSCKAVYEKNFKLSTASITERLLGINHF